MSSKLVLKNVVSESLEPIAIPVPEIKTTKIGLTPETVDPSVLHEQAQLLLQQARVEAERIVALAQEQATNISELAKENGFAQGYKDGSDQAMADTKEICVALIASAERVVFTANEHRERILGSIPPIVTEVVMESVKTLIGREMELKNVDIEPLIENLLKYVIQGTRIEIRVHPDDFANAVSVKPKIQDEKLGEWDVMVIADPNVHLGTCKIRSDSGYVDSSMDAKLKKLRGVVERHIGRVIDECN